VVVRVVDQSNSALEKKNVGRHCESCKIVTLHNTNTSPSYSRVPLGDFMLSPDLMFSQLLPRYLRK
jgi:hypothetical protein